MCNCRNTVLTRSFRLTASSLFTFQTSRHNSRFLLRAPHRRTSHPRSVAPLSQKVHFVGAFREPSARPSVLLTDFHSTAAASFEDRPSQGTAYIVYHDIPRLSRTFFSFFRHFFTTRNPILFFHYLLCSQLFSSTISASSSFLSFDSGTAGSVRKKL